MGRESEREEEREEEEIERQRWKAEAGLKLLGLKAM
jgi:hypothetical protein